MIKPFVSDQTIQTVLNDPLASRDLLPGDVIHVPFSAAEKEYMEKKFKSSNEDPFETARSSAQYGLSYFLSQNSTWKNC